MVRSLILFADEELLLEECKDIREFYAERQAQECPKSSMKNFRLFKQDFQSNFVRWKNEKTFKLTFSAVGGSFSHRMLLRRD